MGTMQKDTGDNKLTDRVSVFIEKAFWLLIAGISAAGVSHLSQMAGSMSQLNEKIAVVIERLKLHDEKLQRHEIKIENLERKKGRL